MCQKIIGRTSPRHQVMCWCLHQRKTLSRLQLKTSFQLPILKPSLLFPEHETAEAGGGRK